MTAFLPLRTHPFGEGALCVGDGGGFFTAPADFLARLAGDALTASDRDFLLRGGHLIQDGDGLGLAAHTYNLAERLTLAGPLDYLILVPTLRCNLSCSYCQVSRANLAAQGFDWTDETLGGVLKVIDSLETDRVKIEFQGGEPTLRPDLIRAVIERCEAGLAAGRLVEAQFVICTNCNSSHRKFSSCSTGPIFTSAPRSTGPQRRTAATARVVMPPRACSSRICTA